MELKEIRAEIDRIDNEIAELIRKRFTYVEEVTEYKRTHQLAVLDSAREQEVLERAVTLLGESYRVELSGVFQAIMEGSKLRQSLALSNHSLLNRVQNGEVYENGESAQGCLRGNVNNKGKKNHVSGEDCAIEKYSLPDTSNGVTQSPRVGCQGAQGAYSELSARDIFDNPILQYYSTFEAVFQAVSVGEVDFGVLPLENSTAGSVNEVYDLFMKYRLYIVSAQKKPIHHALLGIQGAKSQDIKSVYSHPQALMQCSHYIHSKNYQVVMSANTALASASVAKAQDCSLGAIASMESASLYGLVILEENIQNELQNMTRFIAVSRTPNRNGVPVVCRFKTEISNLLEDQGDGLNSRLNEANKMSFIVSLPHQKGALARLLWLIASCQINITKLESRPIPSKPFEFLFYLDIEGNVCSESMQLLLKVLPDYCQSVTYLGSYLEDEQGRVAERSGEK